jgi:MATE family multidrug resistance protein
MALWGAQMAALLVGGRASDNADVIALAAVFLKVAAAFQVFDALQVVGALSLRGLKDARAPMIIAAGAYWLVGAPVCFALGFGLHMRGLGVWIGMAVGLAAAAIAMVARFQQLTRPDFRAAGPQILSGRAHSIGR